MGYQETYVITKKQKDFEGLVKYIQSVGVDYYSSYGAMPVQIIKFTDNTSMHQKLKKGYKAIYFTGERFIQNNKARILGFMSDDEDYNSEQRKLSMWEWLEKINVVFTEEVNSDFIWGENGADMTAIHEEFKFDDREEK